MTLKLLTLPPSTNHIYGRSRGSVFMNERARRAKEGMAWEARSQYRGKPLTGPLKVSVALYWGDRRKHDVDNIKVLLDALTGIVWEDDGQIVELHTRKSFDKVAPRVEIIVGEMDAVEAGSTCNSNQPKRLRQNRRPKGRSADRLRKPA